jgi:hypothetical protein
MMYALTVVAMTAFTFRCPNTALLVQGWSDTEVTADDNYEAVTCTACGRVHFVSARTGSVVAVSRPSTSAIKGQPN